MNNQSANQPSSPSKVGEEKVVRDEQVIGLQGPCHASGAPNRGPTQPRAREYGPEVGEAALGRGRWTPSSAGGSPELRARGQDGRDIPAGEATELSTVPARGPPGQCSAPFRGLQGQSQPRRNAQLPPARPASQPCPVGRGSGCS